MVKVIKEDDSTPFSHYYGRLQGKLYGEGLAYYMINETFQRVLDKHEAILTEKQNKMIKQVKDTFKETIESFHKKLDFVNKRLWELEKIKLNQKENVKESEKEEEKIIPKVTIKKKRKLIGNELEKHLKRKVDKYYGK